MKKNPTVVVIDDDVITLKLLQSLLTGRGMDVRFTENPETGRMLVRAKHPDLVILDIYMPGTSGIDLLQSFRRDPETAHVPIIMLTGEQKAKAAGVSIELGASAYFTKPFQADQLQAKIDELLTSRSS